jgi:hypothetical protein
VARGDALLVQKRRLIAGIEAAIQLIPEGPVRRGAAVKTLNQLMPSK